jgi:tetratricopeptide (TPR) repeat protein
LIGRVIVSSLFLMMSLGVLAPGRAAGAAGVCERIHASLFAGKRPVKADADAVSAELAGDQSNYFKRFVAGEVLASLGLYGLANEQFAAADKLQKDYVLSNFKSTVDSNHYVPALLFTYLLDKYPQDPAVLYFVARHNMEAPVFSRTKKEQVLSNARKQLKVASSLPKPWPGTLSTLAMLEYNEGAELTGQAKEERLDAAIKYCERELQLYPENALAQKIKILALCRKGVQPWEMLQLLQQALKVSPRDAGLNLLLGKACIYKGNYKSAMTPALTGLFESQDAMALSEAREEVYLLIRKVNRVELLSAVDEISQALSEPGSRGRDFMSTLMRMRLADLFSMAGDRREACKQLSLAYQMHPHFKAAVAFKLGYELAMMHEYYMAYPYVDLACRLTRNKNSSDYVKYSSFRSRIARIGVNSSRDIALKLKTMFAYRKVG